MTFKVRIIGDDPAVQDRPSDWGKRKGFCIEGNEVEWEALTLGDLTDRIALTEAHLSRITGLVVKIETRTE